jgi:hypothetical protein
VKDPDDDVPEELDPEVLCPDVALAEEAALAKVLDDDTAVLLLLDDDDRHPDWQGSACWQTGGVSAPWVTHR